MVTASNHPGISRQGGGVVSDSTFEPVTDIAKLVDFLVKLTQQLAAPSGRRREKLFQHGKLPERFTQRHEFARRRKSQRDAAGEPSEVKDSFEFLANLAAHHRLLDEVCDGIKPGFDGLA